MSQASHPNHTQRRFSLRAQIIRYFLGFALLISLLFGATNFLNLYVLEDGYIEMRVLEEADYFQQQKAATGNWPTSRVNYIARYERIEDFPEDIRNTMLEEPERIEASGEGERHFHIYHFPKGEGYLLAEVGSQLLIRKYREGIFWILGIASFLMMIVALYLGYKLAGRALNPLTELADEVSSLSPDELPEALKGSYPGNEVGQLASVIERSMVSIANYIEREQDFTRDASHELRTPVAIIKSSLKLLEGMELGNEQREHLRKIESANERMAQTINTLLAMARQSSSSEASTKVLAVVETVIVEQSPLLEGKDVEVEVLLADNQELPVSKEHLHILMTNLIGNAFQYTSKGQVEIGYQDDRLYVKDTGSGIDEALIDKVTDTLIKGESSEGFGIGLSLVKRLCEFLAIEMQIDSSQKGTEISLRFPQN